MGNTFVRQCSSELRNPTQCKENKDVYTSLLDSLKETDNVVVGCGPETIALISSFAFIDAVNRRGKKGQFMYLENDCLNHILLNASEDCRSTFVLMLPHEQFNQISEMKFAANVFIVSNSMMSPSTFVRGFARHFHDVFQNEKQDVPPEVTDSWNEWQLTWKDMTLPSPMHLESYNFEELIDRLMYWSVHFHDQSHSVKTYEDNIVEQSNKNKETSLLGVLTKIQQENHKCIVYASFSGEADHIHIDETVTDWMKAITTGLEGVQLVDHDSVECVFIYDGEPFPMQDKHQSSFTMAISKLCQAVYTELESKYKINIHLISNSLEHDESSISIVKHAQESINSNVKWTHLHISEDEVKQWMSDLLSTNSGSLFKRILSIGIPKGKDADFIETADYATFCLSAYTIVTQMIHTGNIQTASCINAQCNLPEQKKTNSVIQLGRLYAEQLPGLAKDYVEYVNGYANHHENLCYVNCLRNRCYESVERAEDFSKMPAFDDFCHKVFKIVRSKKTFAQLALEYIVKAYGGHILSQEPADAQLVTIAKDLVEKPQ
jgi:hypothetical protein